MQYLCVYRWCINFMCVFIRIRSIIKIGKDFTNNLEDLEDSSNNNSN